MNLILGNRYRDKVSGWEGTLTARYEYMNGCVRVELSAADKDGAPKGHVFDQEQVEPVVAEAIVTEKRRTGGPRDSKPVAR